MSSANYKVNSIYALIAKASGAVAALLTTMLLARALSSAEFGGYVLAYTVVMLGSILGPLGMGNAVLRFAGSFIGAGTPGAAHHITRKCVAIGLAGLVGLSSLVVLLHPVATDYFAAWPTGIGNALLIGVWLWGAGMVLLLTSSLRAFGKIGLGAFAEITLPRVALLMGVAALFYMQIASLTAMLAAAAAVNILAAGWAFLVLVRAMPSSAGVDDGTIKVGTRRIVAFALPLLGSNVLFQLMTDATLLFVATYCGFAEVAMYGAAYRVYGFLGLPQNAVASAIQGRIAELHAADDRDGLEEIVRTSASLATLPTALVTAIVCIAAGPLLGAMFGEFYAGGQSPLILLCLAQLAFVALGPAEHLLAMSGGQRTVLIVTIVSAFIAVGLAWLLTQSWGMLGAATAAAVAIVSFKLLLTWQAYQQMQIRTWLTLPGKSSQHKPLLATATSGDSHGFGS